MSSYLETFDTDNLMLLATDLRHRYSKKKEIFHNISQRYYMQAIASKYYKESDIRDSLDELEALKNQYLAVCDILKARGFYYAYRGKWQSKDGLVEPDALVSD